MIGTKLAHYEITAHLGSGGMGDVYQATDTKLGRSVAIKFLPEALSDDTEPVERFQREARALARFFESTVFCRLRLSFFRTVLMQDHPANRTSADVRARR